VYDVIEDGGEGGAVVNMNLKLILPLQLLVVGCESQEPTRLLRDFRGCAACYKNFQKFLAKTAGPMTLSALKYKR